MTPEPEKESSRKYCQRHKEFYPASLPRCQSCQTERELDLLQMEQDLRRTRSAS